MNIFTSLRNKKTTLEDGGEENFNNNMPEMSEVDMGRREFVKTMFEGDGINSVSIDVSNAWETLVGKRRPTPSTSKPAKSIEEVSVVSKKEFSGHEEEASEYKWSNDAEEGSGTFGTKVTSPMPEVSNNAHWISLEFGHDTYGKLSPQDSLKRTWHGVYHMDKRTQALRSYILGMEERLQSSGEMQNLLWKSFEEYESFHREQFIKMEDERQSLRRENLTLREELDVLKKEQEKTQRVLVNLIEFVGDSMDNHMYKSSVQNAADERSQKGIPKEPTAVVEGPLKMPLKGHGSGRKGNDKGEESDDSASTVENDGTPGLDAMAYLNFPLINPNERRRLIEQRKIPKPTPNKEALNSLPKYGGPTNRMSKEEVQKVTLSWLSSVEGVVLSQDATIQDVYDKLPNLLEDNARIWFQQCVMTFGHFKTWNDFRQAILLVFLGPDWKHSLERSFAMIKQEDKEPGVNFVLRVWNLAKQIDPAYKESAILAKIATTMKPRLWNRIPRDERNDYFSLVRVVAVYDEENHYQPVIKDEYSSRRSNPRTPVPTSSRENNHSYKGLYKKKCYQCGSEGHVVKDCPHKKLVATSVANNEGRSSGKVRGALLGTK